MPFMNFMVKSAAAARGTPCRGYKRRHIARRRRQRQNCLPYLADAAADRGLRRVAESALHAT